MSTTSDVMGIVPGVMGLGLVGESMKMLPKGMIGTTRKGSIAGKGKRALYGNNAMYKPMNYKKQNGTMIKGFANIAVGTALIGGTAGMINKL